MAEIILRGVRKNFGNTAVIKGVDLHIENGEFVVFVGPSGCGKSTLLRLIAGLEDITEGDLQINGRIVNDIPPKERGIAMVFQSYAIFPHMSVWENMAFGLTIAGANTEEKERKVAEAARILQMEHLLDRRPSQLSGGQRQRVAIGRAIVRNPTVFLFDEPLSNLDAALRMDTRMELHKLHRQLKTTMIYVTHDQVEAMTLADKIVVLRDGEVQQIGAPMDLYHNPINRFVAGFLGSPPMNFLEVTIQSCESDGYLVSSPALDPVSIPSTLKNLATGQTALLGLRPQYLQPVVDGQGALLHGTVMLTERLGTETILDMTLRDNSKLVAALAEDVIFAPSHTLDLSFDPQKALLFRSE